MSEGLVTEDHIVGRFQKNSGASIQVSLVHWEGKDYIDVREVVPSNKPGEQFAFTKKGIRINADLVDRLQELLAQVQVSHEAHTEGPGREASED